MERVDLQTQPRRKPARLLLSCLLALASAGVAAHHTYAMYDLSRRLTVSGTVAKFEWTNPHSYIWVYVPSTRKPGTYELYTFENGSPAVLSKEGWSRSSLKADDRISVEYSPSRDGKPGGHCRKVTLADGHALSCPGAETPLRRKVNP